MRDELRNERARFKEDRALWKTATEKLVNAKQSTIDKKDEELKAAQEHIRLCKLNSQDLNGICKEQNEVIGRLGASVRNLTKASADAKKENAEVILHSTLIIRRDTDGSALLAVLRFGRRPPATGYSHLSNFYLCLHCHRTARDQLRNFCCE